MRAGVPAICRLQAKSYKLMGQWALRPCDLKNLIFSLSAMNAVDD
jgi:hypothetical protein